MFQNASQVAKWVRSNGQIQQGQIFLSMPNLVVAIWGLGLGRNSPRDADDPVMAFTSHKSFSSSEQMLKSSRSPGKSPQKVGSANWPKHSTAFLFFAKCKWSGIRNVNKEIKTKKRALKKPHPPCSQLCLFLTRNSWTFNFVIIKKTPPESDILFLGRLIGEKTFE